MTADPQLRGLLVATRATDSDIIKLLAETAKETAKLASRLAASGQTVRAAQLRLTIQEMRQMQETLWNSIDASVRQGITLARTRATESAVQIDEDVARRLGGDAARELKASWKLQASAGVKAMVARSRTGVERKLSAAVYRNRALSSGLIEKRINVALAQGLSAAEMARDVRGLISPNVKGGISYAAMRLARTEIANAHHAAQIAAQVEVPWVDGFKWHLSSSHPKPDICNVLSNHEEGLGTGIFTKESVPPGKPHPHCLCYLTPDVGSDAAFIRAINSGAFDQYLSHTGAA